MRLKDRLARATHVGQFRADAWLKEPALDEVKSAIAPVRVEGLAHSLARYASWKCSKSSRTN
jgi:hypothetical protein